MAKILNSIVEATGQTPLVKLNRLDEGLPGNVAVKLEFYNPAGSVKDRIGRAIIDAAEKSGALKPGGTISGSGKYLKEQNPNVKVVAVEPKDSPLLSEGRVGPHKIQGLGANFVPETLDRGVYDSVTPVSAEDAMRTSRLLATQEGILGGISSGAAVWAALEEAKKSENKDKLIVAIVPDFGERYISTALYEDIRG